VEPGRGDQEVGTREVPEAGEELSRCTDLLVGVEVEALDVLVEFNVAEGIVVHWDDLRGDLRATELAEDFEVAIPPTKENIAPGLVGAIASRCRTRPRWALPDPTQGAPIMHHRLETAVRRSLVGGLIVLIVGGAVLGAARSADAAEFFAMIANLTGIKKPNAFVDVTADSQGGGGVPFPVDFTVFDTAGGFAASFSVLVDAEHGFASSASAVPPNDNLFTAAGGFPAVVLIRTPNSVSFGSATLHQKFQRSQLVLGLPPSKASDGSRLGMGLVFAVNPGAIRHRATLLIGNVSGSDVTADVHLGTRGAVGNGAYTKPLLSNHTIWIVEIDPAHANTNLIVVSSGDVVAQLVVDEGKKNALTGVTLLPLN
jgi:hypothetical protein